MAERTTFTEASSPRPFSRPHGLARLRARASGEAGLSLVELLIAMMLMLVIMGAIYGVWNRLEKAYVFAEDDMLAQSEARMALGEIVEFVRTARVPESPPNDSLGTVIPFANPYEIWIWTDVDRDANHDLELVRFVVTRENGQAFLIRQESTAANGVFNGSAVRVVNQNIRNDDTSVEITSVANPLFEYFDSTGTQLTPSSDYSIRPLSKSVDVTKIRSVSINLRVDIDPTRSPIVHELSSVVQPRNLRQY